MVTVVVENVKTVAATRRQHNSIDCFVRNTGVCGIALIILAFVSLYLFIKNSLYLRWVYRDFKLFFKRVEALEIKVTDKSQQKANPFIGIIQGVATREHDSAINIFVDRQTYFQDFLAVIDFAKLNKCDDLLGTTEPAEQ